MVPKRMDARWAALFPPGRSISESSSLSSSLSVPQSSESARFLEIGPDGAGAGAAAGAVCVIRKKGLVDSAGAAGAAGAAEIGCSSGVSKAGVGASEA